MLDDLLAKSNPPETLAQHTDYVVKNLLELKERYFDEIPDEDFWKDAVIAALFHDLGKLCENFQDMIQRRKPFDKENYVRHEFLSGMFLFINSIQYYSKYPLSLFAVFSHHKALTKDLFTQNRHLNLQVQEKHVEDFLVFAQNRLSNLGFGIDMPIISMAKSYLRNPYFRLLSDYEKRFFVLAKKFSIRDRKIYIFHKALSGETFESSLKEDIILPMMYMDDAVKATIDLMESPQETIKIRSSYNVSSMSFSPASFRSIHRIYARRVMERSSGLFERRSPFARARG